MNINSLSEVQAYSSKDIAVVVPTKDRPEMIKELLLSLAAQSVRLGRIIVIDSGEPVDYVLEEFVDVLPLEYHRSLPGQIRQRKLGLSLLDESTPLVATIDDDLVFEPSAFAELLKAWNSFGADVGGVGFNSLDAPPKRYSLLGRLFFMSSKIPGVVTISGYNTSIAQVSENLRTSWLGGGYTVWKLSVLNQFEQEEITTRWAIGEDVRLSYAISKRYKLYVAHRAVFKEQPVATASVDWQTEVFRGYKGSAAFYYFVKMNEELSTLLCLWMLAGRFIGKLFFGIAKIRPRDIFNAIGIATLLVNVPFVELKLVSLKKILED